MNIAETKEFAATIASAIVEAQRPSAPVSSETVTVGYNSDPELDKLMYCANCLRGTPFLPSERVVRDLGTGAPIKDARGNLVREDGGVVYTEQGERRPVGHVLSYDLESARALVAKGKLERCRSCGQKRSEAIAYDGRRA